ncbi:hypothetical protein JXB01_01000 [Candidatus Micrarchaeota archaeon]|nr:hypothetical protein [Candidatus Micrarchaeota archaeon]
MRKSAFIFLLLMVLCFAQESADVLEETAESSPFEIIQEWRVITVTVMLVTVGLIALAKMTAISFNMPDLSAWANVELRQTVVTAFILLFVLIFLNFSDVIFAWIAGASGIECPIGETKSCAITMSETYVQELIDLAEDEQIDLLKKAYSDGRLAGQRSGLRAYDMFWLPLLQIQISVGWAPHKMLDVERYSIVFDEYTNALSSLYAQHFFLSEICYKVGPIILILGLVARSFFMTRRLGGLLIAIAIAVMFVFPLMYVFDWVTMGITLYGDQVFGPPSGMVCPDICFKTAPVAYNADSGKQYFNESLDDKEELVLQLCVNPPNSIKMACDALKEEEEGTFEYYSAVDWVVELLPNAGPSQIGNNKLCEESAFDSNYNFGSESAVCSEECRRVPYPLNNPECDAPAMRVACSNMYKSAPECFLKLTVEYEELSDNQKEQYDLCPEECRTIPPLRVDCFEDVQEEQYVKARKISKDDYDDAPASSLSYYVQSDLCPAGTYLVGTAAWDTLKPPWVDSWENCDPYKSYCALCLNPFSGCTGANKECMVYQFTQIGAGFSGHTVYNCGSGEEYENSQECAVSTIPENTCVYMIPEEREGCEGCVFSENYITYNPMVVDCETACEKNTDSLKIVSSGQFAEAASKGLYGTPEIRNVSSFYIPAYLLPLFNILITVLFIQSFSPIFGGDIEIPGLEKIL